MPDIEFVNLLGVLAIGLLAPLLLGFAPKVGVPAVVLEIDVRQLRGRLLGLSVTGYAVSLAVGLGAGLVLRGVGWIDHPLLLAVTVSATSLGLVVAVLTDAQSVDGALGQTVIAASSVADFAAVLLLSLVFSGMGGEPGARILLLALFVGLVVLVGATISASARSMRLGAVLERLQDSTAEIRVRAAMVLLLQATSLPFIVTATQIGVVTGRLAEVTAAGLVCAGLVSVLVFPLVATSLGLREPAAGSRTREPSAR